MNVWRRYKALLDEKAWIRCRALRDEERLAQYVHRLANYGYDSIDHAIRTVHGLKIQEKLLEVKHERHAN